MTASAADVREMIRYFNKRLVAIAPKYRLKGEPKNAAPYVKPYSATVIEFEGSLSLLTAGHVINDIDALYKRPDIEVDGVWLLDDLNIDSTYHHPVPFEWETAAKVAIDEDGLDFGVVNLRPLFARALLANGVAPINEANWIKQRDNDAYERYFVLGLPEEENLPHRVPNGGNINVSPHLVFLEPANEVPESVPLGKYPIHVFRILLPQLDSVKGMSGGPIIGTRINDAGDMRYWVLGVLRSETTVSGLITGCPMPVLGAILRNAFDAEDSAAGEVQ